MRVHHGLVYDKKYSFRTRNPNMLYTTSQTKMQKLSMITYQFTTTMLSIHGFYVTQCDYYQVHNQSHMGLDRKEVHSLKLFKLSMVNISSSELTYNTVILCSVHNFKKSVLYWAKSEQFINFRTIAEISALCQASLVITQIIFLKFQMEYFLRLM